MRPKAQGSVYAQAKRAQKFANNKYSPLHKMLLGPDGKPPSGWQDDDVVHHKFDEFANRKIRR